MDASRGGGGPEREYASSRGAGGAAGWYDVRASARWCAVDRESAVELDHGCCALVNAGSQSIGGCGARTAGGGGGGGSFSGGGGGGRFGIEGWKVVDVVGSGGSEVKPALRNTGALVVGSDSGGGATTAGSSSSMVETGFVAVAAPTVAHPDFLNPPPPAGGAALGSAIFATPTGANPPPPPPNLAQPPPFFGVASATMAAGAGLGAAAIPTPALVPTASPAAPICFASSLASRLRSFSRRRSVSPDALLRSSSAALSATARARWWWSYELVCCAESRSVRIDERMRRRGVASDRPRRIGRRYGSCEGTSSQPSTCKIEQRERTHLLSQISHLNFSSVEAISDCTCSLNAARSCPAHRPDQRRPRG